MKKLFILLLLICLTLTACAKESESISQENNNDNQTVEAVDTTNDDEILTLRFKDALSYDYLKKNDGKIVTISGYMATSSPVDGSFIFLMNLPYQSCPFCKPNTSMLSNTMEVYPKKGQSFDYNESAISVTGKLVVTDSEDENFTDEYGYTFNFKITDATYEIIDESKLSDEILLWNEVASSNVISEVYSMLDFVNFVCDWPEYYCDSYEDIDGNIVPGFYLYASDALNFLYEDDAQYNYGVQDNYFENIIKKFENLDQEKFSEIIEIIKRAKTLANEALEALNNEEYTFEYQYVEKFETEDYIYTLNKQEYFLSQMEELYNDFSIWFSNFLDNMEM